jgi:hypothetical protein
LVKWIGNNSRAELVERRIHFAFLLQFLNTAFVSFLVYGVFGSFSIVDSINKMFGKQVIALPDRYTDLDRNWYTLVGIKVLLPVMIGIFSPTLVNLLTRVFGFFWRKFRSRRAATVGKYLKARNPPQFPLESNYVKVQVMMFTAFTFSAGIPLLVWFLFACLTLAYWADKIDLLRFSRKPPLFSEELISSISQYTPFALILHLLFAIVFLSNADIFPREFTFNYGLDRFLAPITNPFLKTVLGRAYQSLPLTILLLLFLVAFIAERPLLPLIDACTLKPEVASFEGDEFSYRESYDRIKHFSLPNYNLKLNPKYERFLKLFAANFDEQKFSKQQRDVF